MLCIDIKDIIRYNSHMRSKEPDKLFNKTRNIIRAFIAVGLTLLFLGSKNGLITRLLQ